jgi:hypothetical protein
MTLDLHHTDHEEALSTEVFEKVVGDDLVSLTAAQRAEYYQAVCRSVGLNALTKPLEFLHLNGRLRLYALRDATDQLRRLHGISITIVNRQRELDIYVVTARATDPHGRTDESTGAVAIGGLKGEPLANALMKAETKAKRRSTLSICGLGWLDETELDTIPGARVVPEPEMDHPAAGVTTVLEPPPSAQAALLYAITDYLKEHYPQAKDAMGPVREAFGVQKWSEVKSKSLEELQAGYAALQQLVDPDEVDVPEHDTPDLDVQPPSPPTPQNAQEGIQPPQGSTIADDPLQYHSEEGELDEEDDTVEMASPVQMATLRQLVSQVRGEVSDRIQRRLHESPQGLTRDEVEEAMNELRAAQNFRKA